MSRSRTTLITIAAVVAIGFLFLATTTVSRTGGEEGELSSRSTVHDMISSFTDGDEPLSPPRDTKKGTPSSVSKGSNQHHNTKLSPPPEVATEDDAPPPPPPMLVPRVHPATDDDGREQPLHSPSSPAAPPPLHLEGDTSSDSAIRHSFTAVEWTAVHKTSVVHPFPQDTLWRTLQDSFKTITSRRSSNTSDATAPSSSHSKRTTKTSKTTTKEEDHVVLLPLLQQDPPDRPVRLQCPPPTALDLSIDTDAANIDQKPTWVKSKYDKYAKRCEATNGVMWGHLSLQALHRITDAVVDAMLEAMTHQRDEANHRVRQTSFGDRSVATHRDGGRPRSKAALLVLDWASGCGGGTTAMMHRLHSPKWRYRDAVVVGLDVTPSAVQYARSHNKDPTHILYCDGDGTQLDWLPRKRFDLITSFGGLLHLPPSKMCRTVWTLLTLLRPSGMMWSGYIDDPDTAEQLVRCTAALPPAADDVFGNYFSALGGEPSVVVGGQQPGGVRVTVLKERAWFKGMGMPKANRRRNPVSVVWEKIEW